MQHRQDLKDGVSLKGGPVQQSMQTLDLHVIQPAMQLMIELGPTDPEVSLQLASVSTHEEERPQAALHPLARVPARSHATQHDCIRASASSWLPWPHERCMCIIQARLSSACSGQQLAATAGA